MTTYWVCISYGTIQGTGPTPPVYGGTMISTEIDPPGPWHLWQGVAWSQDAEAWIGGGWVEPPVPEITGLQLELMLIELGLLDTVEGLIAAIPDPATRNKTRAALKRSTKVARNDDLITQFSVPLGLTDAQIDVLFRQAATL